MIEATLTGAFLGVSGGGIAYAIWKMNKPGERLFYTVMGMIITGPIPFSVLWADRFTAFSIESINGAPSVITFLVMAFGLPLLTAFIGEIFNL